MNKQLNNSLETADMNVQEKTNEHPKKVKTSRKKTVKRRKTVTKPSPVLMPNSQEIGRGSDMISDAHDTQWRHTEDYLDKVDSFEEPVWEDIRSTASAGKLFEERVVVKCVKDRIPEKFNMNQGEFFGKHLQLEPYQVSKLVKRSEVRAKLEELGMEATCVKDSMLDKVSSLQNQFEDPELIFLTLNEMYEANDFEYPTVAKYEARVFGLVAEQSRINAAV
tara:strand:+ start:1687 stop:2349 length:663 start_codon:yes stop_codon:yes gene_type:complete